MYLDTVRFVTKSAAQANPAPHAGLKEEMTTQITGRDKIYPPVPSPDLPFPKTDTHLFKGHPSSLKAKLEPGHSPRIKRHHDIREA